MLVGRSGYADFSNNSDASEKRFFAEKSRNSRGFSLKFQAKRAKILPVLTALPSQCKPPFLSTFFSTRSKRRSFRRGARRGVPQKTSRLVKKKKKERKSNKTSPLRRREPDAAPKARKLFAVPIAKFSACNKIGLMDFGAERIDAFFRPFSPRRPSFVDR